MNTMKSPSSIWPAALVVLALTGLVASVAGVRSSGVSIRAPDPETLVMRELRFEDRADGSVQVIDHRSNQVIDAITGEAGFARGVLRGFARDRRAHGVGPELPLQLHGRVDGRLTLMDPATGRIVDLESFGRSNSAVFGRMLPTPPQHSKPLPQALAPRNQ